jgi:hypothetical protein
MKCCICMSAMEERFRATIMNRHLVTYYHCGECGYLATEEPYWLDEAYKFPINASDTGILRRNTDLSRMTAIALFALYGRSGKFVDYAGGFGILTRMMRDLGFNFYWHDRYCANLFARGFEYTPGSWEPDLVTCYEAFEHFVEPPAEVEKMLGFSRNILFTTELLPQPIPLPEKWWYYGLDHGQHVSFYSRRTLERLASRFRLSLSTDGRNIHFMSERKLGNRRLRAFHALARLGSARLVQLFSGSRTIDDMNRIRAVASR